MEYIRPRREHNVSTRAHELLMTCMGSITYSVVREAGVAAAGLADLGILVASAPVDDAVRLEAVHPGAAGVVVDVDVLLVAGAVGAREGVEGEGRGASGGSQSGSKKVGELHLGEQSS